MLKTHLVEIFSSIQGEGLYVGVKQIFIRFAGCNLKCRYCDTDCSPDSRFRSEVSAGSGRFDSHSNPVSPKDLMNLINRLNPELCHSISLTGGEPLLHSEFIRELAFLTRQRGIKLYLESNGTLIDELIRVIDLIDFVSMDIKLPSSAQCGLLWPFHEKFLRVAQYKNVFVKMVVTSDTTEEEFVTACETVRKVDENIPLVIQPVSSHEGFSDKNPSLDKIIVLQDVGLRYLTDVRIIPQTHKYLGLL